MPRTEESMSSTMPQSATSPILHMICGKIASGKTTLAAELARKPGTLLISEDEWLSALYGDQMSSVADYVHFSRKLRKVMAPHVSAVLAAGLSVVLDFPANTPELRFWMRDAAEQAECRHILHFLDRSDDVCKARLRQRNQDGEHPFVVTDAQYDHMMAHFVSPAREEGFEILTYSTDTL